jgi:hypothetical protein
MNPPIRTAEISLGDKFVTCYTNVQYREPVTGARSCHNGKAVSRLQNRLGRLHQDCVHLRYSEVHGYNRSRKWRLALAGDFETCSKAGRMLFASQ